MWRFLEDPLVTVKYRKNDGYVTWYEIMVGTASCSFGMYMRHNNEDLRWLDPSRLIFYHAEFPTPAKKYSSSLLDHEGRTLTAEFNGIDSAAKLCEICHIISPIALFVKTRGCPPCRRNEAAQVSMLMSAMVGEDIAFHCIGRWLARLLYFCLRALSLFLSAAYRVAAITKL
jgi:hypothetical protein